MSKNGIIGAGHIVYEIRRTGDMMFTLFDIRCSEMISKLKLVSVSIDWVPNLCSIVTKCQNICDYGRISVADSPCIGRAGGAVT